MFIVFSEMQLPKTEMEAQTLHATRSMRHAANGDSKGNLGQLITCPWKHPRDWDSYHLKRTQDRAQDMDMSSR